MLLASVSSTDIVNFTVPLVPGRWDDSMQVYIKVCMLNHVQVADERISHPHSAHNVTKTNHSVNDFPILSPKDGRKTTQILFYFHVRE